MKYALKVLKRKLKAKQGLLDLTSNGLSKCHADKKEFKAARNNIPFYKEMVIKTTNQIASLKYAIRKLKQ